MEIESISIVESDFLMPRVMLPRGTGTLAPLRWVSIIAAVAADVGKTTDPKTIPTTADANKKKFVSWRTVYLR